MTPICQFPLDTPFEMPTGHSRRLPLESPAPREYIFLSIPVRQGRRVMTPKYILILLCLALSLGGVGCGRGVE